MKPEHERSVVISGKVEIAETGRALDDARVEVVGIEPRIPRRFSITGRDGEFRLPFRASEAAHLRSCHHRLALRVADRRDRTVATVALGDHGLGDVRVLVKAGELAGSAFDVDARQAVLRDHVMPTIEDAIRTLEGARATRAKLAFDAMQCGLPPVLSIPDLLYTARNALRGRGNSVAELRDVLNQFAAWNATKHPAQPALTDEQARKILHENAKSRPSNAHAPHAHDGVLALEAVVVLTAAAGFAGYPDPVKIVRNLQIIHEQLHAARFLGPLLRSARTALDGEPATFARTIEFYGGLCPGELPHAPGGLPFAFPPAGPWYPGGIREECPELIDVVAEALARETTYTLTGFSPANACPGDTITITGTGLAVDTLMPMVGFRVEGSREPLFVEPRSFTSTAIEVVVPDTAICGELTLLVPFMESRVVCGQLFEFPATLASSTLPPFDGGTTTIRAFRRSGPACLHAGEAIVFTFEVCSARSLHLRVSVQESPPPTGGASSARGWEEEIELDPTARSCTYRATVTMNAGVRATLVAEGCDRSERTLAFGIQRPLPTTLAPFERTAFSNWHRNVTRSALRFRPGDLDELVDAVRTAERLNLRVGVMGTAWSYTDCIVPRRTTHAYVDTDALRRGPLQYVLSYAGRRGVDTVYRNDVDVAFTNFITPVGVLANPAERLVHVEAGIKLHELNCVLDRMGLAIPNLGGANGQSIAGTINTSTHGANCRIGPIPDLVRAIHLVANGGQQWWIEPDDKPITDEARMRELMARGVLDPCLELHYNARLFDAVLTAMGNAGIVYSVVLEAVRAHTLEENTEQVPWRIARERLARVVDGGDEALPWYLEVSVNPTLQAWVTTRELTNQSPDPIPPPAAPAPFSTEWFFGLMFGAGLSGPIVGLGAGLVAFAMGGLSLYFARKQAEIGLTLTNPPLWWRLPELYREIELVASLIETVEGIIDTFNAHFSGPAGAVDEALAVMMPNLINVMWRIGFYHLSGKQILDVVQNTFTSRDQRPPGRAFGRSYMIYTEQTLCAVPPAPHVPTPEAPPLVKLIYSQEYVVQPAQLVPFADDVLAAAQRIRDRENRALIVIVNLRFTQATRASLGIQQHPLSGHVEIWTVDRIEGNELFYAEVDEIVARYDAIPHWGHAHPATDLRHHYSRRHAEWEQQLDRIATHAGRPNTFRHQFALARQLLTDLPE